MKILIVTHYFHPHIGGIEIVAYNQAKELVKSGHKVTIITSKLKADNEYILTDKIRIIRINALNPFEKRYHVPYPLFSPKLASVLTKEIQNSDLVVLHGALYMGSVFGVVISKFLNKKVITIEHVGFVPYNNLILNTIQRIVFLMFGKIVLNLSNKVLVLNPTVKKYVSGLTNTPIDISSNGVDTKLFHPVSIAAKIKLRKKYNLPLKKKIVLFVGRFVQKKGLDLVLRAKKSNFDLILVGSGVIDLPITDTGIHIFKNLPQTKIAEIYQISDLYILPSRSEGFPLSILEAMASGLPVITTGKIYLGSINNKLIKLIKPEVCEIKNAIKEVLNDIILARKMSAYSRNMAISKFTWKKSVSSLQI
ncbi:MAG: glycosyltransferase family 4 protein [Bacteroidota bacterium]